MEKELIKAEIIAFKNVNGGTYSDYYIGITNDIERRIDEGRLFVAEHINAGEYTAGQPLETWECETNDDAVEIERHFQQIGMEKLNKRSYGIEETVFVYCYKMDEGNKRIILNEQVVESIEQTKNIMTKYQDFIKTLK